MVYGQSTATCSKCGRKIRFIRMKSGKSMPCDMAIVFFKDGGKDRIVLQNGLVIAGTIVEDYADADGCGYISHFATCEYANMFRKKRKSG